jgi:hypothetical protein
MPTSENKGGAQMAVAGKEEDAVRSAVMDYIEGWFDGDAGRMTAVGQNRHLRHIG